MFCNMDFLIFVDNLSFPLSKELKSVQDQLAAEGSRCQKLEVLKLNMQLIL
jgi:hypothetical protein